MSAPLKPPVTYQQALQIASATVAAQRAPKPTAQTAHTVTVTSSVSIIAVRERAAAQAKSAIRRLWASVNPYSDKSVADFAAQAARIMSSAQTAAARAAAVGQVQQLAAVGVKASATHVVPVDVRAKSAKITSGKLALHRPAVHVAYDGGDTAKITARDMTTASVFERPAQVFRYATSIGAPDAAIQAGQRIDTLVDDNLMLAQRLAQQQVLVNAVDLDTGKTASGPTVTGYRRVIHPELSRGGTCGMCIAAADRIYKVSDLMPIHAHCQCTVAAVTEEHDPGDDANAVDLKTLYAHAGGNTAAHLKRTRYQVDEHGELGPVLVPKKAYKARGADKRGKQPETPADVARRNLEHYKQRLDSLRAQGNSADAAKIAYLEKLINKFSAAAGR